MERDWNHMQSIHFKMKRFGSKVKWLQYGLPLKKDSFRLEFKKLWDCSNRLTASTNKSCYVMNLLILRLQLEWYLLSSRMSWGCKTSSWKYDYWHECLMSSSTTLTYPGALEGRIIEREQKRHWVIFFDNLKSVSFFRWWLIPHYFMKHFYFSFK